MALSSCSSRLGWGVLLWSTDDPFVAAGTVLPIYARSNIEGVWVVGLPEGMLTRDGLDKMEVPFARLEMARSRAAAYERALAFAPYALVYAENLQAGLLIRANPVNSARRVYRLREGDIIKVLGPAADGVLPVGMSGEPLPGRWYRVLTDDGFAGYVFSYRLRLFEQTGDERIAAGNFDGAAHFAAWESPAASDSLDLLLSRTWVPESQLAMINSGRINLDELARRWGFDPGRESGVARISMPDISLAFPYSAITPSGSNAWRFEGTTLSAQMHSNASLSLQFTETGGGVRNLSFVSAPSIDDVIARETSRRARAHNAIVSHGPVFTSSNFGTIVFGPDGAFTWSGFELLVPQHIPRAAQGRGTVAMDLFLSRALETQYNGAFTMRFAGSDGRHAASLHAMYSFDSQGFRLEIVPEANIDGGTVVARRSASPVVLFFSASDEIPGSVTAGLEGAGAEAASLEAAGLAETDLL